MTTTRAHAGTRGAGLGRPFAAHLSAVGCANLADGVVQTGIGLLAVALTRSPLLVGTVAAAAWLPWLVLGLPAGVLVDRWDRRTTMVLALSARAALLAGGGWLALTDRLTIVPLVALALGYGATEVFVDLAAQAQVPALVGSSAHRLQRANARLLGVEQVANGFVGPPTAGFLVAGGAAWVLGLPAVGVLLAVVTLGLGLRGSFRPTPDRDAPPTRLLATVSEGFRIVWRHPILRPLLLAGGLWNVGSAMFGAVLLLWLVGPGSAAGLSPQAYGLAATAFPVGALLGSALAGPVLRRWPEVRVMVSCWGANAVLLLVPLVAPNVWGTLTLGLTTGLVGVLGNVVSGALRPRMVPAHQLGRVGGASRVLGYGAIPLGALAGGQLGELAGLPVTIVAASAVTLLATALVALTVSQPLIDAHDLDRAA